MIIFQTKSKKLGGTSYDELIKKARRIFHDIESQSKRKPYIRSAYFDKDKVFFDYFWEHLNQKPRRERIKRLAYLPCGIELIKESRHKPVSKVNPNRKTEILHRFIGETKDKEAFYVQIK